MLSLLDPLLAPLSRLLVARGVHFTDFAERMKKHYVDAAEGIALTKGQKVTDSRLSVLTGLQRRDIARLKAEKLAKPRPNPLARLVALWQTDPRFSHAGKPRPLTRSGLEPSFDTLAREVRRDVHPRTMLDSLIAAGTVKLAEDETVTLEQGSYQPLGGTDDQVAYLAANAGDHLSAATENVLGRDPRHFERAVHIAGLTSEQIAELDAIFREAEMDMLARLNQTAASMKRTETGPLRFRAGGYFYSEDAP